FTGGSHPAANGGAWMTAVFGFGGVLVEDDHVVIQPRLPTHWRRLEFGLARLGDRFRIRISPEVVTVEPDASNRASHPFTIAGQAVSCEPGRPVTVRLENETGAAARPENVNPPNP